MNRNELEILVASEPSEAIFMSEGLNCMIARNPELKTYCGYVGIPKEHKFYGLSCDDTVLKTESTVIYPNDKILNMLYMLRKEPENVPLSLLFNVHGGLSYASNNNPLFRDVEDTLWWLGFDCGHSDDLAPFELFNDEELEPQTVKLLNLFKTMQQKLNDSLPESERIVRTYKDFNFVKNEIESLAKQLNTI